MRKEEFRAKMLILAVQAGELLLQYASSEDAKKEPEQVRKCMTTILTLLTETEDFLQSLGYPTGSDSSIAE